MKWLLDTNTLSELTKAVPSATVVAWLEANEAESGACGESALSAISIGEMTLGIQRWPEGKKRRRLERTFKFLRQDYAGKILDFTEGVAVEWGNLVAEAQQHGRNLSVLDSQIEATAIHFGLTMVTRNRADFFHRVLDPWDP